MQSVADVATSSGSKYLQQLCKHWGHRFTVAYDAHRGEVDFGFAKRLEAVADDHGLRLTVEAENEVDLIALRGGDLLRHRRLCEGHHHLDFAAQRLFVELECGGAVSIEVQVGIEGGVCQLVENRRGASASSAVKS